MQKREWMYPLIGILMIWITMSGVARLVHQNRYQPASDSFRLM